MNGAVFLSLIVIALEGAAMLLLPNYSPRRFLFAVTVDPRFRVSEIPQIFPVHYGVNGPDRWVDKTPLHVYGVLLYGAAMMLVTLLLTVGTFYGSRRTAQRRVILKVMVLTSYLLAYMFARIGLNPLLGFSPWWIIVPLVPFTIAITIWLYRAFHDPEHPAEATPDDRWYLGQFYYNPDDAAVFVQRRMGLGYTLNFGNRWTWLIVATLVATTLGLAFALR